MNLLIPEDKIICPECGSQLEVLQVLQGSIADNLLCMDDPLNIHFDGLSNIITCTNTNTDHLLHKNIWLGTKIKVQQWLSRQ